jgi:hypothetical protein
LCSSTSMASKALPARCEVEQEFAIDLKKC